MNLAIPLIALGGLYIVSKKPKKEGLTSVNTYSKPNQTTDKFFKPVIDEKSFVDLAGREIDYNQYVANMVPFFGKTKNIGGSINAPNSDQALDNMGGGGTFAIAKSEVAPLFKPEEHIQWANGSPNQSDFYQSRVNPGTSMNNVKPFAEQRVAPGINQGFTTNGSGGFNSGTESRSLWMDKTVNELRVASKPKETYELSNHEGPAQTLVKNLGHHAKVDKHLPDRYFVNTPERYLTTTGEQVAPTVRSIQPDPTIHRATTTKSYVGVAGNGGVQQQAKQGMYRTDQRQPLKSLPFTPAGSSIQANNLSTEQTSYNLLPTNRSTVQPESFGALGGLVAAITAPITDMLRPTRKEDLVGLTRIGNLGSSISNAPIPQQSVSPTIKETTVFSPLVAGSRPYAPVTTGGYKVMEHLPLETQRDTTSVAYVGNAGSTMPQPVSYEAQYNASISANRMTTGRIAGGNSQVYAPIINQTTSSNRSTTHASYIGGAKGAITPLGIDQFTETRNVHRYTENTRNTPDLLDAFKKNPYTHSLSSVA